MKKSKKLLSVFLALLMLITALAPTMTASATTRESIRAWRYVNVSAGSVLNLRESASTNSRIIGTLPRGAILWVDYAVTVGTIRWGRVEQFNNRWGYVDTQHLRVGSPFAPIEPINGMRFAHSAGSVNVYDAPGGRVLARAQPNQPVWISYAVWAGGIRWAVIGNTGYINSRYLRMGG